ncbi:MAG: hypothetical protein CK425_10680 [Parachlamydia sp.]|nr:MAG: hypothetical protein CK425_10680 [Parachlamydia sp.]
MKVFCVLFIYMTLGLTTLGLGKEPENKTPKLLVRGEARLLKPAEKILIHVGVVTQNIKPEVALAENNGKTQKVIMALQELGLNPENYKTGQFAVRPRYSDQAIVGYEAVNSLAINTDRLDLAGEIISAVNKAGVNTIDSIQFTLKDPREYRAAAIQTAAANAMADALTLAQATGVKLVRVLELSIGDASERVPSPRWNALAMKSFSADSATPIESGDVEVFADVSIAYEISSS